MLKTLAIEDLEIGMFVKDIILKNSDHKVKNQGTVNSPRTIELLKKQGAISVVVKLNQEQIEALEQANDPPKPSASSPKTEPTAKTKRKEKSNVSLSEEFENSCRVYDEATENVKRMFSEASRGQQLTTEKVLLLADEITESVFRNEYAMTILTRIRQKSNYHWEHSINTAILICGFSLYLGLNKEVVKKITLGALFHDIGSAKVPRAILDKQGPLTSNEYSVMQKHITWGIEIGKRDDILNDVMIDMMVNHHERLDGSGYPRGLTESKLSKLARITAIVDVYDAITGDKSYKKGIPPIAAMRHLMSEKDKLDQNLVQQFIKFAGVYPVGSLVKLSNDKLAIITECNRDDPLKPILKVIYSTKLNSLITPKTYNLVNEEFTIASAVREEDYKLNLSKIIRDMTM